MIATTKSEWCSNHGSYYYSQLASHQLIANDIEGARQTIRTYFNTIYMTQVTATGEQVCHISPCTVAETDKNLSH